MTISIDHQLVFSNLLERFLTVPGGGRVEVLLYLAASGLGPVSELVSWRSVARTVPAAGRVAVLWYCGLFCTLTRGSRLSVSSARHVSNGRRLCYLQLSEYCTLSIRNNRDGGTPEPDGE